MNAGTTVLLWRGQAWPNSHARCVNPVGRSPGATAVRRSFQRFFLPFCDFSCEIDFFKASMMLTTLLCVSGSSSLRDLAGFFDLVFSLLAMMSFRRSCTGSCTRSEEHTSELQSIMRTSYADFCSKTKKIA